MSTSGISIEGVSKRFGGQLALREVSMRIPGSAVTALLGENGSGKSTLIKILAGIYQADAGEITVCGDALGHPIRPRQVHRLGLRFVHQDRGLVEDLSVADNFAFVEGFLTRAPVSPVRWRREHRRVEETMERLGIEVDPDAVVGELDLTLQTMVAIARAVQAVGARQDGILVLDEPTAALPAHEVERVLEVVRTIRDRGAGILYVSHRLDEVIRIADGVVVLRDGAVVHDGPAGHLDKPTMIEVILGRPADFGKPSAERIGVTHERAAALEVEGLKGHGVSDVSLQVRRGEVVGLAGLVGCGRSELCRIIAGAQKEHGGLMSIAGAPYGPGSSAEALARGVSYVPQDRTRQGAVADMSLQENVTLGTLDEFVKHRWLSLRRERKAVLEAAETFAIRPPVPGRVMRQFSGGNQQKAVLARAVRHAPRILVLDEPFQGIDVGAKAEIARLIRSLAGDGIAVIVGSSDPEDLIGLCDRVAVLDRGAIETILEASEMTVDALTFLTVSQSHDVHRRPTFSREVTHVDS